MSKRAELTGTKHNKLTGIRFDTEQKHGIADVIVEDMHMQHLMNLLME